MSTPATISALARPDHEVARRALLPVAVGSACLTAFLAVMRADTIGEWAVVVPFDLVVAALVFGLVVRRGLHRDSAGGPALTLGLLAVPLALVAFWSGLPMLLGTGATLLGYAGKRAGSGSGKSIAALVLGLLAVVAYVGIYATDWIANPGASWIFGSSR